MTLVSIYLHIIPFTEERVQSTFVRHINIYRMTINLLFKNLIIMKSFRFLLFAALTALSVNVFAQQKAELGVDWDATTQTAYYSPKLFEVSVLSYTVSEMTFTIGGGVADLNTLLPAVSKNTVYINDATKIPTAFTYAKLLSSASNYLEGKLNVDGKKISSIKINGTSNSTSLTSDVCVVYSDQTTFNSAHIIGYESPITMPIQRAGNSGVVLSNIPAHAKSFRIYNFCNIQETVAGSGIYEIVATGGTPIGSARVSNVAYVSATSDLDVSTPVDEKKIDRQKIVRKELFDISGHPVANDARGLLLQKNSYEDGTISFRKVYITE